MIAAEMELPLPVQEEPPLPSPEELPQPSEPEPMIAAEMELPPPVQEEPTSAYLEELPSPSEPEPMDAAEMELTPQVPVEIAAPSEPETMAELGMEVPPPILEEVPQAMPEEPPALPEPESMAEVGMEVPLPEELPSPSEPESMVEAGMELPTPEEVTQDELEMVEAGMELPQEGELMLQPEPETDAGLEAYEIAEATGEAELLEAEEELEEEYSPWDDAPTVDLPDYPPDRSADTKAEAYIQEDEVAEVAVTPEPAVQEIPADVELASPLDAAAEESEQVEEEDIRATSPIDVPPQLLSSAVERLPESDMVTEELAEDEQVEDLPVPTLTLARLAVEQSDFELAKRTLVKILYEEPNNLEAQQLLEMVRISIGEPVAEAAAENEPVEQLTESADTQTAPAEGSTESIVRALQRWLNSIKLAAERRTT
jgi:hypothetical protein